LIRLALAIGDYDHVRDLAEGRVRAEGLDLTVLRLPPEEVFARFSARAEWEAAEFSFALYTSLVGRGGEGGEEPPVAIPAFPSRVFRHGAFFTRADGPTRLEDLAGARIGIPEWAQTAGVWARGILAEHHGVDLAQVRWRQGGVNAPGRKEKATLELPGGVVVEPERERSLDQLLREGELDAVISARPPAGALTGELRPVLADPRAAERAYWEASGVFPIMHVVVLRPDFHRANPWAATSLFDGLDAARSRSVARMLDATASHAPLPWISDLAAEAAKSFGGDLWPYGIDPNRPTIETFARYAHEQGLTPDRLTPEDLFPAAPLPVFV
jgi:4,5-dihydroxyphthalate decarboxylase